MFKLAISSRPFVKFHYPLIERDIAISKESVRLSLHPLKHYSFTLYFCLRVKVFTLKFIRPHILFEDPLMDFIRIFIKNSKFLCLSLYSYIIKTLEEFHLYFTCW